MPSDERAREATWRWENRGSQICHKAITFVGMFTTFYGRRKNRRKEGEPSARRIRNDHGERRREKEKTKKKSKQLAPVRTSDPSE